MPPAPRCSEVSQMGGAPRTPVSVFRPLGSSCASASRVCACHSGRADSHGVTPTHCSGQRKGDQRVCYMVSSNT